MDFNSEQKKAIENSGGPLLIIAGAGSGKTRVITSKIIHLINEKKAKPSEILALTFTEKAANEMVERVDCDMPLGYEEICIKTFHSFSDTVLREYGLEIGIDPGYEILSGAEQWFFFKKNLLEFELDYYRPLGNPNRFITDLLKHFGKLKDELIEPEEYLKYAEKLTGEEKEKTLEIAKAYKKYQELIIQNNYLDFADLTFFALKLLNKRSSVLQALRERYKYLLVDEFQDTNYAQFQLVLKLAQEHKNLTVVGDDDQSIYKWRGASLSNILQFEKHFPTTEKIVLLENYRSNKNILESAYSLIQNNNPDRLEAKEGINKKLKCNVTGENKVEVHNFPNFIEESSFVAQKIKSMHENEGIAYGDFAILVRANNHANPFIDELKYLGVPYQVRNPKGLLSLPEIKDLIAVVRFLANQYDDISLLRVLQMDLFEIENQEILDLLNHPEKKRLFDLIQEKKETLPGLESGTTKVADILKELISFSKKENVGVVLNKFFEKSEYLKFLVDNDRIEEMQNINEFAKQVARFERSAKEKTVYDFVSYLDMLEEAGAVLSADEFADRDAVQILTVHGAKGLEFECVFIVNAVNQRFPGTNRKDTFEIPDELTKEIFPEGDFHLQEERRLFYVGMTRAKKKLFVTLSERYEGNKKWKASVFAEEILRNGGAEKFPHAESEDAIKKLQEFQKPEKPIFDLPPFKRSRVSYSQLDTFKMCPLKYNYRYLMNVPARESAAANFGSSVHDTLKEFYQTLKRGGAVSIELLRELYVKNWIPYGYESPEFMETRKKKGLEMLEKFYEKNSDPFVVPAFLEKNFHIKIGAYSLSGRIDRIDKLADGSYEVIDYKTGRMKDALNLKKDLQLSIYALACKEIFDLSVSKLSLYFLEDNEKVTTERSDAQINEVRDEILETIEEMKKSDFSPTPGFYCQFCDYRLICPAV